MFQVTVVLSAVLKVQQNFLFFAHVIFFFCSASSGHWGKKSPNFKSHIQF